jgi:hypothetical protein
MNKLGEYRDRGGLVITIGDREALVLYDDAVDAYAAGRPSASLIAQCLERVPLFALGRACEAVVIGGPVPGWPPSAAGLTRRERQHLEIVADAIMGCVERAGGLAREHLAEFPTDRLIAAIFVAEAWDREDSATTVRVKRDPSV